MGGIFGGDTPDPYIPPPAPVVSDTRDAVAKSNKAADAAKGYEDTVLTGGEGVVEMEKIKKKDLTGG